MDFNVVSLVTLRNNLTQPRPFKCFHYFYRIHPVHQSSSNKYAFIFLGTTCSYYHWFLDNSKPMLMKYSNDDDQVVLVRDIPVLYMANEYGFTFSAGITFCQSIGGRMTNYSELQTVWNLGYERCGCAWLDDGKAYVPMQSVVAGCFSAIGMHVCDWQSTWDLYCTINLP